MQDYERFFEGLRSYSIPMHFYECERTTSVEELYQAFKARLMAELVAHDGSFNPWPLPLVEKEGEG